LDGKVGDATGKAWYKREYKETASKYAYDIRMGSRQEPFQGIYNRIANDMMAFRRQLSSDEVLRIRTTTELKFARHFSPEAFSDHLADDGKGHYTIVRLPAENDP